MMLPTRLNLYPLPPCSAQEFQGHNGSRIQDRTRANNSTKSGRSGSAPASQDAGNPMNPEEIQVFLEVPSGVSSDGAPCSSQSLNPPNLWARRHSSKTALAMAKAGPASSGALQLTG